MEMRGMTMRDAMILLGLALMTLAGFPAMKRVDRFLNRCYRRRWEEGRCVQKCAPLNPKKSHLDSHDVF